MSKYKTWLLYLMVTCVAYGASVRYGFSQDDYYFLLISRVETFADVVNFFNPWAQQGFAFYRPLGTQLYFFLSTLIAGMDKAPFVMHSFMIFIHSINAYLAYKLSRKIVQSDSVSLWVGAAYATSAAHFLSLFYISATQQLLAALFGLLSLNSFISKKRVHAAIFYGLALLCKENAILIPGISFLLWHLGDQGKLAKKPLHLNLIFKNVYQTFLPYAVVGVSYVLMRIAAGITVQSEYHPVIGFSLINTLRWYFFFGYGAPEILLNYSLPRMAINFVGFVRDFGVVGLMSVITTLFLSIYSLVTLMRLLFSRSVVSIKKAMMYVFWWIGSLILIIWYPDHRYPHYVDIGLIPLLMIVLEGAKGKWRHFVGSLLIVGSLVSIAVSIESHWTVKRAEIATKAQVRMTEYEVCEKDAVVFQGSQNLPQELSYVLSLANGPRVLCGRPDMGVYYGSTGEVTEKDVVTVPIEGLLP